VPNLLIIDGPCAKILKPPLQLLFGSVEHLTPLEREVHLAVDFKLLVWHGCAGGVA
jgi:hypothetical protein